MSTYSYCEKSSIGLGETKKADVTKTVKEVIGLLVLFGIGTGAVVLKTLIYVNF